MEDAKIILLESEDWKRLVEVSRVETEAFGHEGLSPGNLSLLARCGKIFAVLENDSVTAEAVVLSGFATKQALLFSLAVRQNFRNGGRGKKLLLAVCNSLAKENFQSIELTVSPNNTVAISLYEKFEFEKIEFKKDLFGPGQDRWILRKKLEPVFNEL
jgi:ribosomal-protein-alanine N-acetyltransferase